MEAEIKGAGEFAQLLYDRLYLLTDDFGRYDSDSWTVKLNAMPTNNRPLLHFETAIKLMADPKIGLIRIIQKDSKSCLEFWRFFETQEHGIKRRTKPKFLSEIKPFPGFGSKIPRSSEKFPEVLRNSGLSKGKVREVKRREENNISYPSSGSNLSQDNNSDPNEPDSEYDSSFLNFWNTYPKKESKRAAYTNWDNFIVADGIDPVEVISGAMRYDAWVTKKNIKPEYVKFPAAFLKNRYWDRDFGKED